MEIGINIFFIKNCSAIFYIFIHINMVKFVV